MSVFSHETETQIGAWIGIIVAILLVLGIVSRISDPPRQQPVRKVQWRAICVDNVKMLCISDGYGEPLCNYVQPPEACRN